MMSSFVYNELDEFKKEFKKLLKKYPSLENDLELIKVAIENFPEGYGNNIVPVSNLGIGVEAKIMKVRRFPCKSLKDSTSLRLLYAYKEGSNCIDLIEIELVEIYHKNTKDNHNIERIIKYYGKNVNQ